MRPDIILTERPQLLRRTDRWEYQPPCESVPQGASMCSLSLKLSYTTRASASFPSKGSKKWWNTKKGCSSLMWMIAIALLRWYLLISLHFQQYREWLFLISCFFLSDCYLSNVILVSTCSFNTLSIRPVNAFLRWRMVIMPGVFSMLWTTSMVFEIYTWRSSWDRISILMCNLLTISDIRSI